MLGFFPSLNVQGTRQKLCQFVTGDVNNGYALSMVFICGEAHLILDTFLRHA